MAVIGTDLVDAFFGPMEPIGKRSRSTGHPVKVVGVAEKKGSVFGESQDNFVWIPLTTFRKFYGARRSITIQAEAVSMDVFEEAQDQARVAMRVRRHLDYDKPDDFSVETGESVMDLWQTRHPRDLRGDDRGDRHQPDRGRHRGHEHHARLRHRAHPRDRGAQGAGGAARATSCGSSSWSR